MYAPAPRERPPVGLRPVANWSAPSTGTLGKNMLVVHASQTGNAERIGRLSAAAFPGATVRSLATLDQDSLRAARRALFVVATYGEGDAPDRAASSKQRRWPPRSTSVRSTMPCWR